MTKKVTKPTTPKFIHLGINMDGDIIDNVDTYVEEKDFHNYQIVLSIPKDKLKSYTTLLTVA